MTSKTDKAGHKTSYVLDANGRIVETIDALGNSTLFEYDPMGRLTKTSLHRVDAQDKADEWEITLYEYDGRGLVTKETNALGAVTAYTYDGNGNLVSKKDADGYETKYTYNALDFVTQINYNGGKQASYRYNKVGELVEMEDWTGTTSFEVDLLRRITQVTDRKGNVVEYGYDEVGNQTSIDYPDGTGVDYAYDLLGQLKTVIEEDGRATAYSYDGMGCVVRMEYPHGWVEDYVYDSIGQLLRVDDTDPTRKDMKQQKHVYKYDDCGNMVYEYMRGNGTGEATTENTYTYDALHRLTRVDEVYGKAWREYQYDSLGNLTYESNSNNVHYDYKLNNLNQITQKTYSSNDKEGTLYTYDNRGNLVLEQYGKLNGNGNNNGNGQRTTVGQYTYDETNKMVLGVNSSGESSAYLYNGLGALVEDTWKIAKNGYGYHDVDAGLGDADPNSGRGGGGSNGQGHGNGNGQGNGNGSGDKPTGSLVTNFSTVVKEFVVDYTSPTFEPLMEHEVNGLDYRYVYGNDRLSVNITGVETSSGNLIENGNQIRLYYHMDYLGTTDYLTSPVSLKVTSWTHYNEWGEITHNAVLKTGKRELDLVKRYATHDYDAVLGMYYAKARFYDAENRRFASVDPVKGEITNPLTMVQYIYAIDCPLIYIDVGGEKAEAVDFAGVGGSAASKPTTNPYPMLKHISSDKPLFPTQLTVTANQVRMRSGPGLNYPTIGSLNKGDKVVDLMQMHHQDGYSWHKVQVNGIICWVADHYLKSGTGQPSSDKGVAVSGTNYPPCSSNGSTSYTIKPSDARKTTPDMLLNNSLSTNTSAITIDANCGGYIEPVGCTSMNLFGFAGSNSETLNMPTVRNDGGLFVYEEGTRLSSGTSFGDPSATVVIVGGVSKSSNLATDPTKISSEYSVGVKLNIGGNVTIQRGVSAGSLNMKSTISVVVKTNGKTITLSATEELNGNLTLTQLSAFPTEIESVSQGTYHSLTVRRGVAAIAVVAWYFTPVLAPLLPAIADQVVQYFSNPASP